MFLGVWIILLNYVLSAVSLYTLSFYKIPAQIILSDIDKNKETIPMARHSIQKEIRDSSYSSCVAKQFGEMRILDLQHMNWALLSKWWWRFKDPTYSNLWKTVLQVNMSLNIPLSPFWKKVQALSHLCNLGMSYQLGATSEVIFWSDTWFQHCLLKLLFFQII